MKKLILYISAFAMLFSCHNPEYILPTATDRQGLTSLTAFLVSGQYANGNEVEVAKYAITDPEESNFVIPIPWFYPEASDDETLSHMLRMRIQAQLQPNWKITPALGVLDLTEENEFTLTDPYGKSRQITIRGKRFKSSNCRLLAMMVEDVKTSCVIYENESRILIPYLEDLSAVSVSAQVFPHAMVQKINGKDYDPSAKYNLNTGATVTVLAHDGKTSKTYDVEQGIPTLLYQGLRDSSVLLLSCVNPVSVTGLPDFNTKCYVSLAGKDTKLIVATGEGRSPVVVNAFTGMKESDMVLGEAVADCITNDDAGHILLCDFNPTLVETEVKDGNGNVTGKANIIDVNNPQVVRIWSTDSPDVAPSLVHSFVSPLSFPVGHRMKVLGDITKDAVIVFTAEGIAGYSTTASACYVTVKDGVFSEEVGTKDFSAFGLGWGPAPVDFGTVVPASLNPARDGWFLDYYQDNSDPSVPHGKQDCYILHYISGKDKDNWIDLVGNWAHNPNCLDIRTFNGARYLTLFAVSHFPEWDIRPRIRLYDASSPSSMVKKESLSILLKEDELKSFNKSSTNSSFGAAGDVVMVPSSDGYRMYIYFYDHHDHTIGAYVSDCFEI